MLGTEDGLTEGRFSVKQINWLGEQLKIAHADDPKKPIFVFHHQPMTGTVYGSEWGFTENRDLMLRYVETLSTSHYLSQDIRIIH